MNIRFKQIFERFLYPLFDDVLKNDFKGEANIDFENLIYGFSNLFFQKYTNSIEIGAHNSAVVDKFVEEYLLEKIPHDNNTLQFD